MSKHTPEPWECFRWADHTELAGYPSSVGNSDELGMEQVDVCRIDCTEVTKEEAWANARLIAAAPELLEALRELHDFSERCSNHRHAERSRQAFERAGRLLERLEIKAEGTSDE